jgi:membrane protease YdiL (CAAX protease family)
MILAAIGKEFPRKIALRLPSVTHLVLAILIFPSLVILSDGIYQIIRMIVPDVFGSMGLGDMEAAMKLFSNWPLPVAILIIGLGPGIGEELFCRGFLGRGLVGNYGYVAGVAMTSFFFGFIHLEPRQGLVAMFMGLILHFTYLTTRSLLVPMLLHFMNNSFAVIGARIASLASLDNPREPPILLYISALAMFAAVAWTLYRCRARLVAPPVEPDYWVPSFPGVEVPPSWSLTTISHPWPKWYEIGLILLTLSGFIFAFTLSA